MGKESLRGPTGANHTFKKVVRLTTRLVGVFLVVAASTERYHKEPFLDNTLAEPKKSNQPSENYFDELPNLYKQVRFESAFEDEPDTQRFDKDATATQTLTSASESTLEKEATITRDFSEIGKIINSHLESFSKQDLEDLKIYYPIYIAVSEKYGLPWYLLWIIHKEESRVSQDPNAFNGKSGHIGGFQRHPSWSQSIVDKAASGLEYLANLPQRHPTDWKEAAFAAWHLTTIKRDDSILGALLGYSAEGPARYRYQKFLQLALIFDR